MPRRTRKQSKSDDISNKSVMETNDPPPMRDRSETGRGRGSDVGWEDSSGSDDSDMGTESLRKMLNRKGVGGEER